MVEPRMARTSPIVKANKEVVGRKVVNPQGESLGKVEEVMLDSAPGRIAYAVLSFGGFLGMGDKLFAIPWSRLSLDEGRKVFVLDVDRATLEKAPGFDKNNWPDMADHGWGNRIYTYYGSRPYWEA